MMEINKLVEQHKAGLIVSAVGCMFFFVASFFGHNYIWEDNVLLSFVFSLVTTLILFFLAMFLVSKKHDPSRRGMEVVEIVMLTAYIMVALVSGLFVVHFVNTEFAFKEDIKKMGLGKIETLRDMQKAYLDQTKSKVNMEKTNCETFARRFVQTKRANDKNTLKRDYGIETGAATGLKDLLNACDSYADSENIKYKKPVEGLKSSQAGEMEAMQHAFSGYSRRIIPSGLKNLDEWLTSDFNALRTQYPAFTYDFPKYNELPRLNNLRDSLKNPKAKNAVAFVFWLIIHLLILGWYLFSRGRNIGSFLKENEKYK